MLRRSRACVADLGVEVDDEIVGLIIENDGKLGLFLVGLAVLAGQGGQLLAEILDQFADGDVAVRLVAFLVGLAAQAVEQDLGEDAVLVQVERRLQAVVGQQDHPARIGVLGFLVAEKFAVEVVQVRIGRLPCRHRSP